MVHIEKYANRFFTTALHRYRLLNNNFIGCFIIWGRCQEDICPFSVRELQ